MKKGSDSTAATMHAGNGDASSPTIAAPRLVDSEILKKMALRARLRKYSMMTQAERDMISARLLRFKWYKWSKLS